MTKGEIDISVEQLENKGETEKNGIDALNVKQPTESLHTEEENSNASNENEILHENKFSRMIKYFLVVPKTLYSTYSLFFYTLHAYRTQFVVSKYGVEKSAWGLYMAIPQCVSFIFGIVIASLNDKIGIQKYILSAALIGATALFGTFFMIKQFALFITFYVIYFCLVSITLPMIDKVVLEYLEKEPGCDTKDYGRQRLFVPLWFTILGFILDAIVYQSKNSSGDTKYDFTNLLYYGITAGIIALIATLLFVKNLDKRESSTSNMKMIFSVIKNKDFMFFVFIILLNGITRASMTNYLNVYLDDHCGFCKDYSKEGNLTWWGKLHNNRKKAWSGMVGNVSEIAVYMVSPFIVGRLGLLMPMFISQIFQLARFGGYFIFSNENKYIFELGLLIEVCKGLNFGLMQCSAAALAMKLAPPNMKSVAQIVYSGTFVGIGSVIAGVAFKFLFETEKSVKNVMPVNAYKKMFLADILLTVATMLLMVLKYAFFENILFNKKNLEEKLERIAEKGELEEKVEEKIELNKRALENGNEDVKVVKA